MSSTNQTNLIPFSAVDSAWMRMDREQNPSIVTALLILGGDVSLRHLQEVLAARLSVFPRFFQVARRVHGKWHWQDAVDFRIASHVLDERPDTPDSLAERVATLMSGDLDLALPLWRIHRIPLQDGTCALVARVHHCIADGVALNRVLEQIADPLHSDDSNGVPKRKPHALPWRIQHFARTCLRLSAPLKRLALMPADARTSLKGELTGNRCVAWSRPLSLPEIKKVCEGCGGKVNDVLLAILAGAFRRYFRKRGVPIPETDIRVTLPMNLRGNGSDPQLGNRFGLLFADLPTSTPNAEERLRLTKARMDRLKASGEAELMLGVLSAVGALGEGLQNRALRLLSSKVSAVVSNLPGPLETLDIAGRPLAQLIFWAPASGLVGVSVSFSCYLEEVVCSVAADRAMLPDPALLVECFSAEFLKVREVARQQMFAP